MQDNFKQRFAKIEPITKGYSSDKKYKVSTADGTNYLLRISQIEQYEAKKLMFSMQQQVADLGVPMCQPIEFGTCNDGVYSIQSWINGDDLETVMPSLTETEQYALGLKAGEILKKIHTIPSPNAPNDKTSTRIQKYHDCGIRFDGDNYIIEYIKNNQHLLRGRPQCFLHGDYHIGNMMLENGNLAIIDFDRCDFGDCWQDFSSIVWSAQASPFFATGQIKGYFNGDPPPEFFKLLAFYLASNALSYIYWAISFGQGEVDTALNQAQDILLWYDNMQNPVPTWYLKDFYIQWVDGIPFKLKEPFDFSFLGKYGKVFKVFDDQDSGNICFGVANGEEKCFVKFAGATTKRSNITQDEAVERMKNTIKIYKDLAHPILANLISAEEIGGGIAMIFEWLEADCMGRQYPQSRKRFLLTNNETRLKMFDDILLFHSYVMKQGYVAIDFYDGCIMYDFDIDKTIICDIELYAKTPYTNNMGRLWGSSRFMSPEEFELGASIDEITNVYTMGATAFALFGDERSRRFEDWELSKELYKVAKKAVSDERSERQQSIEQFIAEWRAVVGRYG